MFINYREQLQASSERRWYRRTDGRYLPTWAMIVVSRFARKYRSGNGIYNVSEFGVMKVSDYDTGVFNERR